MQKLQIENALCIHSHYGKKEWEFLDQNFKKFEPTED